MKKRKTASASVAKSGGKKVSPARRADYQARAKKAWRTRRRRMVG